MKHTYQELEKWVSRDSVHYNYLLSFYKEGSRIEYLDEQKVLLYMDRYSMAYAAGRGHNIDPRYLVLFDEEDETQNFIDQGLSKGSVLKVYMAYYPENSIKVEIPQGIRLRDISMSDYDYILKHYDGAAAVQENVIKNCISDGMIGAEDENGLCGFIGKHKEGAMGFLYVADSHRRRGIGACLEKALIERMLKNRLLPYCHVVETNNASLLLQRKIGLRIYPELFYWIAGKDYK